LPALSEKCHQLYFQTLPEMPLLTISGTFEDAAEYFCRHFLKMPWNLFAGTFWKMAQNIFASTFPKMPQITFSGF
jgi:hypothetical protein